MPPPPLPPGFVLDSDAPPLPEGFTLDSQVTSAPQDQRKPLTFGGPVAGAADAALAIGTGMGSSLINEIYAAGASLIPGGKTGPEAAASPPVPSYEPRTLEGQAATSVIGKAFAPVTKAIDFFASTPGDSPSYRAAVGAPAADPQNPNVPDVSDFIGHTFKAATTAAPLMRTPRPVPPPAPHPAVANARSLGYTLQPTQVIEGKPVGSRFQRAMERMGGKASTPADASLRNAPLTNELVVADLGLPKGTSLSPQTLRDLRTTANSAYEALRNTNAKIDLGADLSAQSLLKQVNAKFSSEVRGAGPPPAVAKLLGELQVQRGPVNVASFMSEIESLRSSARAGFKSADSDTVQLARAQKEIANILEDTMDRAVSQQVPNVVAEYRAARTQLAKVHLVEDAMNGLNVDARLLARARDSGDLLTGNMAKVADVAENFPQVMQTDARLASRAGPGLLDMAMAVPTLGAWPAARYFAQNAALSGVNPRLGLRLQTRPAALPLAIAEGADDQRRQALARAIERSVR